MAVQPISFLPLYPFDPTFSLSRSHQMPIPYEQLFSSKNTDAKLLYMRLPSYKSLRLHRYRPYTRTRARLLRSPTDMMEPVEDADFRVDMLLADPNPISFSVPMVFEDDCVDGLRTVVSQMIGRDNARIPIGSIHLIIDFALILRNYRRKDGAEACNGSTM